jgi:hypothetical protein
MFRRIRLSPSLATWGVALCTLAWVPAVGAQTLADGLEKLRTRAYQLKPIISGLMIGEIPYDATQRDHIEAIEIEAKTLIYPYILEPMGSLEKKPGEIDKLYRNLESDFRALGRDKTKTEEVTKAFRKDVRLCCVEVMNHKSARPIIKVNAARTLARLAELGEPELVDDLVDILRDPKENDGARYWALRGLGEALAASAAVDPPILEKPRVVKAATAITEFLAQKPAIIDATPPDEVEGYRLLRREAVRALAQVRLPVVDAKVRPAVVLTRFVGNDESILPPPRLDERLEAAMGLLRMRPGKDAPGFQPDYTVEQLAHLMAYFATQANAHREKKDVASRLRPWRVDAARLVGPVIAFRADVKDPYVAEVSATVLRVLQTVATDKPVGADDLTTLSDTKAPNQGVFQGADAVVKPSKVIAPLPGEKPPEPSDK